MKRILLLAPLATAISLAVVPGVALAHERREVGPYQFVVGWAVEPAFEGVKNAVQLRISDPAAGGAPVEGAQNTLQVEVTYVDTDQSVTVPLRTVFNDPGHYQADMIPTQPGVYSFRFFGTVSDTQVNETFTAGEGTFGLIEPAAEFQFPVALASSREIEGVVRTTQETAQAAEDAAAAARTLAFVGIGVGVLGVLIGAVGIVMRRR
jgi:hypothetical protein